MNLRNFYLRFRRGTGNFFNWILHSQQMSCRFGSKVPSGKVAGSLEGGDTVRADSSAKEPVANSWLWDYLSKRGAKFEWVRPRISKGP